MQHSLNIFVTMTRLLILLTILLLPWLPAQDVKVATWSAGKPDTDNYESLAFWIKDEKRAYIRYEHGVSADDVELTWLGPDSVAGQREFKRDSLRRITAVCLSCRPAIPSSWSSPTIIPKNSIGKMRTPAP